MKKTVVFHPNAKNVDNWERILRKNGFVTKRTCYFDKGKAGYILKVTEKEEQ